jgi:hypothetical protein
MLNKFNKDAELLDDLMDHWTATTHKVRCVGYIRPMLTIMQQERNWLIQQMQDFALRRQIRVTFLSGDVHVAAVGVFKTLQPVDPVFDHRYMLNVITSAIVNTPYATQSRPISKLTLYPGHLLGC